MNQKAFYQQLVKRYVENTASDEEVNLLLDLLNDAEFERILGREMDIHLKQSLFKIKANKPFSSRKKVYRLAGLAASLLLLCVISVYLFQKSRTRQVSLQVVLADSLIRPGSNQATLTLANGKIIDLDDRNVGRLAREAGIEVVKSKKGVLVYKAMPIKVEKGAYHTVSTPRGGQYQLVLSDGSKIWLNAASSVTFPVAFEKDVRQIEARGEVYCEITKDQNRLFKVSFGNQMVEVLGTHFNINAYPDEQTMETTLLEGSIRIINRETKQRALLVPGQQAQVQRGRSRLNIRTVDAGSVAAWKDGYFIFKHEPLKSIMNKISRWYDVDVEYEGNIPEKTFAGRISRFDKVEQLLEVLSATGSVNFKIKERRIIVMD